MKTSAIALACLLGVLSAGTANAAPREQQSQSFSYVFGEFDHYTSPNGSGSLDGGGSGFGWRIDRHFGLQGGFQYSRKSGVDLTNGYVEALALLPLGSRFSLYGSIGGAYATASTSFRGTTVSISQSGYRAGVGLEYWLARRWAIRAGFHRQNAGGVSDDVGLGVAYRF
jgi:opacity protein-like surface antigen